MTRQHIGAAGVGRFVPVVFVVIYVYAVTLGTFVGGLWASAGIGGGIVLFGLTFAADRRVPRLDPVVAIFVSLFLGSALLLNLHAVDAAVAWRQLWQQTTIMLPLGLLSSPQVQARMGDRHLWPLVARAAMIGVLALGLEFLAGTPLLFAIKGSGASLTFYNRGISYSAVFAFPVLAFLWVSGRRWWALAFLIIVIVPGELTDSRATRLALYLGLLTLALAFIVPRVTRFILNLGFLGLLLMPWGVTFAYLHDRPWIRRLPPSWMHRVEIWDYMSYRIFERPVLGWGFGSSRLLDYARPNGPSYVMVTQKAGHPHDGILQLWVELGLPGLILGSAFALFVLWRCSRLCKELRPFAYAAWVAALCVSLVAYNFWDDSLFSLFALTMLSFRSLNRWRRLDQGAAASPASDRLAETGPVPQIGRVAMTL